MKRVAKDNAPIALFAQTPFDKILGCSNLPMLRYEWIWEKTNATGFYACPIEDYCNDVSVAWPIIVGNHISLELDEGCLAEAYVLASYVNSELADKINCVDENPLRAAMICFLEMKDAEAETNV
ncbi:phage protein NinX family protein [Vibrio parahaemolyticus]|uniref:phage protein NinX family protein n=1 Tax=Vibrio parahaemolyticus TaxID=670 RepID=UPI0015E00289|nr:phage protein NinX family protein [Vibrio parahaemolyticus]